MVLEFKEIEKSFGDLKVLKRVSFSAQSGKAFGLLGRNGAGKTTSIRIMMNVFSQDGGEVLIDGQKIDYHKVKFGYLPEERGLYPKKKISEQLIYFAELNGLSYKEAVDSVNYWLERLGMSEYKNKRLDSLSKGNQQKIQLITALAHNPDIVILDEPFSGLDPVNAMLLKDVVKEVIANNKIVIFSSHQMNYIEEFCDSIAILNGGQIAICGDLYDIKRNYPRNKLVVRSVDSDKIQAECGLACEKGEAQGEIIIMLPDAADKKAIMQKLTEKYDIDEIKIFEPSLNDIFVEHAGKQI
ncbi:MAG: ATP-binding cassette domain-containing protein [Clostridia bacterium]|nr:ATP-binding cassette domain-containing protein [Clostridia bacterium]